MDQSCTVLYGDTLRSELDFSHSHSDSNSSSSSASSTSSSEVSVILSDTLNAVRSHLLSPQEDTQSSRPKSLPWARSKVTSTPCRVELVPPKLTLPVRQIGVDEGVAREKELARKRRTTPDSTEKELIRLHSKKGKAIAMASFGDKGTSQTGDIQMDTGGMDTNDSSALTVGTLKAVLKEFEDRNRSDIRDLRVHLESDIDRKMANLTVSIKSEIREAVDASITNKLLEMEGKVAKEIEGVRKGITGEMDMKMGLLNSRIDSVGEKIRRDKQLETNVMIFNMKEPDSLNAVMRKEEDDKKIEDLIRHCRDTCGHVCKRAYFRIGAWEKDRNRIIKLVLQNQTQRDNFIEAMKTQRFNEELRFGIDRPKEDRDKYKALRVEIKRREDNGESDLVIRDWKIIKRPFRDAPREGGDQERQ